jgi:3-isopropylmalate/(R)-2-methylmalate dehydratase large subunit
MGQTITEKILAKAGGKKEVTPGDYVFLTSPCPVPGIGRGGPPIESMGARFFDPKMAIVMDDHAGDGSFGLISETEEQRARMLKRAKALDIPRENIYINKGIGHLLAAENCWALPGTVYLSITNGHSTTMGGIGALALTLSYESTAYMILGRTWLRVPESIKMVLNGKLQEGVMSRDISDYILGQIGPAGACYKVLEWTGPVINVMSMDGRFALCNDALHSGGKTGIVPPDKKTITYVKSRTDRPFEPLVSDPDAAYAETMTYDVTNLEPQVVQPPLRWTVKPVTAFPDVKINRAYIGTCFNARIDDMKIAARILKGRKIHPDVRLSITPGSNEVIKYAAREGILEIFADAGCEVPLPCCGMCGGFITPLVADDVCIGTGTCNYPGRSGHHDAQIYLANPATVAASAIEGKITDPRKYLRGKK